MNEPWWYLSFADDDDWKGAVLIQAPSFLDAIAETHRLKINPGGEVRAFCMGHKLQPAWVPEEATNRLLSKADLEKYIGETVQWQEPDEGV